MPQSEIVLIWKRAQRALVNELGDGVCHGRGGYHRAPR